MRHRYLLLTVISMLLGLVACKKESRYPIAGKWQETKLRLYAQDGTGAFLYDTTYFHPFTSSDFIEFNNNGTCVIGADYYYYPNPPGEHVPPQKIPPITSTMNYTEVGSKFVLTTQSTLINPGGFDVRDTVSTVSSNALLLHSITYSHQPGIKFITDAYYSR